jgi:hypothetical protein
LQTTILVELQAGPALEPRLNHPDSVAMSVSDLKRSPGLISKGGWNDASRLQPPQSMSADKKAAPIVLHLANALI